MPSLRVMGLIVGSTFSFAACAGVEAPSQIQRLVSPDLGVVTTREVGSPLFNTVVARTADGIKIAAGSRIKYGANVIEPTAPFTSVSNGFCGPADQVAAFGVPMRHPMKFVCVSEKMLDDQHITYSQGPVTRADPANFQQQLLYEGKVKTELKLSYREFRGDLARPAFTQELSFDLSDGNIVGAKGARIEVVKATNIDITYRVLAPFNP